MLGTLMKMAAYRTAPKATFMVQHPRTALKMRKLPWDMKHAYAPRLAAAAVAAVAMPLGYWLGARAQDGASTNGSGRSRGSRSRRKS